MSDDAQEFEESKSMSDRISGPQPINYGAHVIPNKEFREPMPPSRTPASSSDASELESLRKWKAEALEVMQGLQELGQVLGLRLGEQITGKAAIERAKELVDEHHTMRELYAYRMAFHAQAAAFWMERGFLVTKSWKHSDGTDPFGGGWFIVTAELPTGQVSNHYPKEDWELFDVPEVDFAPTWDGHTPEIALNRILEDVQNRQNLKPVGIIGIELETQTAVILERGEAHAYGVNLWELEGFAREEDNYTNHKYKGKGF